MDVIIFESEAYKRLIEEFRKIVADTLEQFRQDEWLSPEEAMKLLDIKKSKLQKLRDSGAILFSHYARNKIKYSRMSINKYLLNHVPKFNLKIK